MRCAPGIRIGVANEEGAVIFDTSLQELVVILHQHYRIIPMDVVE
jgi:hypothetical protein